MEEMVGAIDQARQVSQSVSQLATSQLRYN